MSAPNKSLINVKIPSSSVNGNKMLLKPVENITKNSKLLTEIKSEPGLTDDKAEAEKKVESGNPSKSILGMIKLGRENKNGLPVADKTGKTRMIRVRQEDGSLVNYFIPAQIYPLAEKLAQDKQKKEAMMKEQQEKDAMKPPNSQIQILNNNNNKNKIITVNLKNDNPININNVMKSLQSSPARGNYQKIAPKQVMMVDKNSPQQISKSLLSVPNAQILPKSEIKTEKLDGNNKIDISKIIGNNAKIAKIMPKNGMIISSKDLQKAPSIPISLANSNVSKIVNVPINGKNGQVLILDNLKAHVAQAKTLQHCQKVNMTNTQSLSGIFNIANLKKSLGSQNLTNTTLPKTSLVSSVKNSAGVVPSTATNLPANIRILPSNSANISGSPVQIISSATTNGKIPLQQISAKTIDGKHKIIVNDKAILAGAKINANHVFKNEKGQIFMRNGNNLNMVKSLIASNTKNVSLATTNVGNNSQKSIIKLPLSVLNSISKDKLNLSSQLKSTILGSIKSSLSNQNTKMVSIDDLTKVKSNKETIKKTQIKQTNQVDTVTNSEDPTTIIKLSIE